MCHAELANPPSLVAKDLIDIASRPDSEPTSATASASTTRPPLHTALCSLPMLTGPSDEAGLSPRWCCAELANPAPPASLGCLAAATCRPGWPEHQPIQHRPIQHRPIPICRVAERHRLQVARGTRVLRSKGSTAACVPAEAAGDDDAAKPPHALLRRRCWCRHYPLASDQRHR